MATNKAGLLKPKAFDAGQRKNRNQGEGRIAKPRKVHRPKAPKPKARKPKAPNRLDNPAAVTQPRTLRDINRDAGAAANLRYGGEQAANALTERRTDPYFEQYKAQIAGIQTGIQHGYANAQAEQAVRTAATQTANDTSRGQIQSSMQQDAASRGATVDPNVLKDDANAANIRRQSADAQANQMASQGQATNDYFSGASAAAGSQQIAQHYTNAAQAKQIAANKGSYQAGQVSDARDAERKYGLEQAAFGLDVAKVQTTAETSRQNSKRTARSQRAARRTAAKQKNQDQALAGKKFKSDKAKDDYQRAHGLGPYKKAAPKGSGGSGGLTPAQRLAAGGKRTKATNHVTDAGDRWALYKGVTVSEKVKDKKGQFVTGEDGKPKMRSRPPTPSEIKQRLIKEGFSTQEIHIGWLLQHGRTLTPADMRTARQLNVRIPKAQRPASRPKKNNKTERAINRGDQAGPPSPRY